MGFAKVIAAMLTLPDAVLGKNIGMAQVTKKNKVHRLSRRVSSVVLGGRLLIYVFFSPYDMHIYTACIKLNAHTVYCTVQIVQPDMCDYVTT